MGAAVAVNWIAVIVAAVVRFAPRVFGKQWQEADGIKANPAQMPGAFTCFA